MKASISLAVLAFCVFTPSLSHADQWSAAQTTNLVSAITNALPQGAGTAATQQVINSYHNNYNQYQGYQTREQISQGLQRNITNNISQLPVQPHIPSQVGNYVNGYPTQLINGQMPNVQGDLQNNIAGQVGQRVNQHMPQGVYVDPYQLMQQR